VEGGCTVWVGKTCVKTGAGTEINSSVGLEVPVGTQEAKITAVSKTRKMLLVLIFHIQVIMGRKVLGTIDFEKA
jgi:hypothetical protein